VIEQEECCIDNVLMMIRRCDEYESTKAGLIFSKLRLVNVIVN